MTYEEVVLAMEQAEEEHRDIINAIMARRYLVNPPNQDSMYYSLIYTGQHAMLREIQIYPSNATRTLQPALSKVIHTINDQPLTRHLTRNMRRKYISLIYDTFVDITNADYEQAAESLNQAENLQPVDKWRPAMS